jgi:hypothetical protein
MSNSGRDAVQHSKNNLDAGASVDDSDAGSIEAAGPSLRKTARAISQRTTDLIAIAIISLGVLTVSGRLTEWWSTDSTLAISPSASADQLAGPSTRWGTGESAVSILAGDYPVQMERRILSGDQDRVDGTLRDRLVTILESQSSLDHDTPTASSDSTFRNREEQLMEMLHDLPPHESADGKWNLYHIDRSDNPIPGSFLIGTRLSGTVEKTESLAAWAVAMPSGPTRWTSFMMTPTGTGETSNVYIAPVPEGAKVIFSLRADSNDELTVFQRVHAQPSDIGRWTRDISSQLTGSGWHEARPWQQSANSATARFEHVGDKQRRSRQAIELSISLDGSDKLTGTANVIAIPEMELVPRDGTQNLPTSDRQQEL